MSRLTGVLIMLMSFAAAAPTSEFPFEVTTLTGQRRTGEIARLTSDQAVMKSGKAETVVPLTEILDFRALRPKPPALDTRRFEVNLVDGSRMYSSGLLGEGDRLLLESSTCGKVTLPARTVASVRLQPLDPVLAESWKELCSRELTQDMLVIRKGNVLDHLDGTAGTLGAKTIPFIIDREEVPVKREKAFGLIFARRNADVGKPICEITAADGDFFKAQACTLASGRFELGLIGGASIALPLGEVALMDFSLGKVRYLSQLEPREVKYTPFFDQVWKYHRDRPRDGGSLRLGNKEYARGLWIHSRTLLKYRLNGEYRRFQAVMGIDQAVAPHGDVHVVISGDGKTLHEAEVKGTDSPQTLDLDVAAVRDLEIFVDFGGGLDIADHLDLADAKVIK